MRSTLPCTEYTCSPPIYKVTRSTHNHVPAGTPSALYGQCMGTCRRDKNIGTVFPPLLSGHAMGIECQGSMCITTAAPAAAPCNVDRQTRRLTILQLLAQPNQSWRALLQQPNLGDGVGLMIQLERGVVLRTQYAIPLFPLPLNRQVTGSSAKGWGICMEDDQKTGKSRKGKGAPSSESFQTQTTSIRDGGSRTVSNRVSRRPVPFLLGGEIW